MAKAGTKTGPVTFFKQVKNEGSKITWPSRKETTQGTIAVFIMVTLAAVFLYVADQAIAWGIGLILGFGG